VNAKTESLLSFDSDAAAAGGAPVAGMDEAGRGPLAGPVVAACVAMPLDDPIDGVNDSKKLSPGKREKLFPVIMAKALAVGVGRVEHDEIDRINILNATKSAMRQAFSLMGMAPNLLLVDAVEGLGLPVETRPMIRGDAMSYNIAAASIVAKVTRDRRMCELDALYPGYGFAKHKGYGSAEHIEALRRLGPCPEHRASFIGGIMGATRKEKGRAGEAMAEKLLMAEGLAVLERNWRCARGELDIIAQDGHILAFVEVKYRESYRYGLPREAVGKAKQRGIVELAAAYLQQTGRAGTGCRFDVVEIVKRGGGYDIEYMKNAFRAEGGDTFL
jgi:ribonuclease HII